MTTLTKQDKILIRSSFKRIVPNVEQIIAMFYDVLLENEPDLQPMFDRINIQDQQTKMVRTLIASVALLDTPRTLKYQMMDLGKRHQHYKVHPQHFDAVGTALLTTLHDNPMSQLNDEELAAWEKLYTIMATAARSTVV